MTQNVEPRLVPSPKAKAWVNEWLDRYVEAQDGPTALRVTEDMGVAFDLVLFAAVEHEKNLAKVEAIAKDFGMGHLESLVDEVRAENERLRAALVEIQGVRRHNWQCSYCKAYSDGAHQPFCADCGKEGGYCGSHDRDLTACYRVMHEVAFRALTATPDKREGE